MTQKDTLKYIVVRLSQGSNNFMGKWHPHGCRSRILIATIYLIDTQSNKPNTCKTFLLNLNYHTLGLGLKPFLAKSPKAGALHYMIGVKTPTNLTAICGDLVLGFPDDPHALQGCQTLEWLHVVIHGHPPWRHQWVWVCMAFSPKEHPWENKTHKGEIRNQKQLPRYYGSSDVSCSCNWQLSPPNQVSELVDSSGFCKVL